MRHDLPVHLIEKTSLALFFICLCLVLPPEDDMELKEVFLWIPWSGFSWLMCKNLSITWRIELWVRLKGLVYILASSHTHTIHNNHDFVGILYSLRLLAEVPKRWMITTSKLAGFIYTLILWILINVTVNVVYYVDYADGSVRT